MKQWYSFYTTDLGNASLLAKLGDEIDAGSKKLKQVASEIVKVNQAASEFPFPTAFAYVPWMHHVLIMQKCRTKNLRRRLYTNHLMGPMTNARLAE